MASQQQEANSTNQPEVSQSGDADQQSTPPQIPASDAGNSVDPIHKSNSQIIQIHAAPPQHKSPERPVNEKSAQGDSQVIVGSGSAIKSASRSKSTPQLIDAKQSKPDESSQQGAQPESEAPQNNEGDSSGWDQPQKTPETKALPTPSNEPPSLVKQSEEQKEQPKVRIQALNSSQSQVQVQVSTQQQPSAESIPSAQVQIAAAPQLTKSQSVTKREKQKKETESKSAQQGANTEETTKQPRTKKAQQLLQQQQSQQLLQQQQAQQQVQQQNMNPQQQQMLQKQQSLSQMPQGQTSNQQTPNVAGIDAQTQQMLLQQQQQAAALSQQQQLQQQQRLQQNQQAQQLLLQQQLRQTQHAAQMSGLDHKKSYIPLKYYQVFEQQSYHFQNQMRNNKLFNWYNNPKIIQQNASQSAEQLVKQCQHNDEQFIRREVIEQKMESHIIRGQHLDLKGHFKNQQQPKEEFPVKVTMPAKQIEQIRTFKPFLESATPEEKLRLLERTLLKPKKRLRKLEEKRDKLKDAKRFQNSKKAAKLQNNHQMPSDSAMGGFNFNNQQNRDGYGGMSGTSHGLDGQFSMGPPLIEETGFKCPVYKCTVKVENDIQLDQHYTIAHKDLIDLGLSLVRDQDSGTMGACIKDTLLTSMITMAVTNKEQFRLFQNDFQEDEANGLRTEIQKIFNET